MGFFDRLENAWSIFKLSFSLLKKDKSLIAIPILMLLVFIIIPIILILVPILIDLILNNGDLNFSKTISPDNYLFLIVFMFLLYFFTTFFASAQAWMIYEVLLGKDTTISSGFKRAFANFKDILFFVFVSLLINLIASKLREKGTLGEMAGNTIGYISGLAGKLVLPAMIITDRSFKEAVQQLKGSLKVIPEIATYEIGIRPLTTIVFIIFLIISLLFGISFGFFAGLIIFLILISLLIIFSVYINQTYYTILYITLIEKKKIKGLNFSFKPVFN